MDDQTVRTICYLSRLKLDDENLKNSYDLNNYWND